VTTTDEATGELRAARPAGADPLAAGAPPPDGAGGNSSSRPTVTGEQVWRAVRLPIGILFLVLLLVLLVIIIGTPRRTGRLEPEATGKQGSRAIAELLRARDTEVRRSTTVPTGASGTLVIARADLLSPTALSQLVEGTAAPHVVLIGANGVTALGVEVVTGSGQPVRARQPGCELTVASVAGVAHLGGETYSAATPDVDTCYAAGGRPSMLQIRRDVRTVTLLGSGDALTNERLDQEGNAALALGLLSEHPTVDWVVHSPAVAADDDDAKTLDELVPDQVGYLQLQLVIAAVAAALWRGRRLGPIVREQLPVVVRAAEAVEGRARLYGAGRARGRAADALRSGARHRLAAALSLAPDAGPDETVSAVGARSRRDAAVVAELLYGPAPSDDESLVRLASELDSLDSEVRRT
jgi:hypothetical protein